MADYSTKHYNLSDDASFASDSHSVAVQSAAGMQGMERMITNPFYIENVSQSAAVTTFTLGGDIPHPYVFRISTDLVHWNDFIVPNGGTNTFPIEPGGRMYVVGLKGQEGGLSLNDTTGVCHIDADRTFDVGGDATTLIYRYGALMKIEHHAFCALFSLDANLRSASRLVLPSDEIGEFGYAGMFYGCENMTSGPDELPDVKKWNGSRVCFEMFLGCRKMTKAPVILHHQTDCKLLYQEMFRACRSLVYVETHALDRYNPDVYTDWLYDVSHDGGFAGIGDWGSIPRGASAIPADWTFKEI